VIRGFTVRVEPAKLGLKVTAFFLLKVRADATHEVRGKARGDPIRC